MSASSAVSAPPSAAFFRLKEFIIEATGLSYYLDKDAHLTDRVERRMAASGFPDYSIYHSHLTSGLAGERELDALIAELTIGETYFFRHTEQFDAIRNIILPDLIRRRREKRRLRIWSAGCAIGAEPYSLSIMLKRDFASELSGWDISILGTDINRDFLGKAREARYDDWAFRSVPPEIISSCFKIDGRSQARPSWILAQEYRKNVALEYFNLVRHPIPSLIHNIAAFDLILCRNVMIYFSAEINRKLASSFHNALTDGGWLVVGHAESNIDHYRSFRTINAPGATFYQKSDEHVSEPYPAPPCHRPASLPTPTISWRPTVLPEISVTEAEPSATDDAVTPAITTKKIREFADLGKWSEAELACDERIELVPLDPVSHFYRALVLEQIGRLDEAEESFRKTLYLDRNFVPAHYHLGIFLIHRNNPPGAARSFRNALGLLRNVDPEHRYEHADGITAGELEDLASFQLELQESA